MTLPPNFSGSKNGDALLGGLLALLVVVPLWFVAVFTVADFLTRFMDWSTALAWGFYVAIPIAVSLALLLVAPLRWAAPIVATAYYHLLIFLAVLWLGCCWTCYPRSGVMSVI